MTTQAKPVKTKSGEIRWRVRFRLAKQGNPVSETFHTQAEALRFAALVDKVGGQAARDHRNAYIHGEPDSMQACFDRYLQLAASRVSRGTLDKYKRQWEAYLKDEFGDWPADGVTREQVEIWVGNMRNRETARSAAARAKALKNGELAPLPDYLATKTIANAHGLLSSILEREVRAGNLDRNVARGVSLPRTGRKKQPVFLTTGEFAEFLTAVAPEWQDFISLLAGTGMRFGEATALTAADIDLQTSIPVIRVTKAWSRAGKGEGYILAPPKTDAGVRTISIPSQLIPILQNLVDTVPPGGLLFNKDGKQIPNAWFHDAVWSPACKKANLGKRPRIHDLRHSHASWLIMQGVPLTVIQRRMGHTSIKVTSDLYGHLAPDAWALAADATEIAMAQALPRLEA